MTSRPPGKSTDATATKSDPDDVQLACRCCGGIHADARLVSLPDGRVVGNYSEEHRIYYEAAWVLKRYRTKKTRMAYLDAVEEKRGLAARLALRQEMMRIWEKKQ